MRSFGSDHLCCCFSPILFISANQGAPTSPYHGRKENHLPTLDRPVPPSPKPAPAAVPCKRLRLPPPKPTPRSPATSVTYRPQLKPTPTQIHPAAKESSPSSIQCTQTPPAAPAAHQNQKLNPRESRMSRNDSTSPHPTSKLSLA